MKLRQICLTKTIRLINTCAVNWTHHHNHAFPSSFPSKYSDSLTLLNTLRSTVISSRFKMSSFTPPGNGNKIGTMIGSERISSSVTPPVVVVLGSTASGKSKLAIDLAREIPGEVISADSMQVYDGLDILTNKATQEEMKGIPHHMIGVVDRWEKFDVMKFRDMALPLVKRILAEGKVPYIVGGTNYYIESLLWKVLIDEDSSARVSSGSEDVSESDSDPDPFRVGEEEFPPKRFKFSEEEVDLANPILAYMHQRGGNFTQDELLEKWSATEIHQALEKVDPNRAIRFHPNDVRKTVRSLQVYFRTGRKHSELIEEQCNRSGNENEIEGTSSGSSSKDVLQSLKGMLGGPMRFSNCICLWIQADRSILNERINSRVDQMAERGLKKELDDYIDQVKKENRKWDFQEGQLQSIGVKEFQAYIQLPEEDRGTPHGQILFEEGLERLKVVTRQYAKRQVQWVSRRFLKSTRRQLPPVYGLDGNDTGSESWNKNVFTPALEILQNHTEGVIESSLQIEKLLPVSNDKDTEEDFISRKCNVCDKVLVGSVQWECHMRSGRHWKMVKRKKKLEDKLELEKIQGAEITTTKDYNEDDATPIVKAEASSVHN